LEERTHEWDNGIKGRTHKRQCQRNGDKGNKGNGIKGIKERIEGRGIHGRPNRTIAKMK
jgi:hypothetical protein